MSGCIGEITAETGDVFQNLEGSAFTITRDKLWSRLGIRHSGLETIMAGKSCVSRVLSLILSGR